MRITALYRHPIKGIGVEAVEAASFAHDGMMGDRRWAVTRKGAKPGEKWAPCGHFLRGASNPALMAVTMTRIAGDGATSGHDETMVLHHPDQPDLVFDPDDPAALYAWLAPLCKMPVGEIYQTERALTDSETGFVSLLSDTSLAALQSCHPALDRSRFRGNLWLDGVPAWHELNLIGERVRVGTAELKILKPIERCKATCTDTTTGIRDFDTLAALRDMTGTQDFGLHAFVVKSGTIQKNDEIEIL